MSDTYDSKTLNLEDHVNERPLPLPGSCQETPTLDVIYAAD